MSDQPVDLSGDVSGGQAGGQVADVVGSHWFEAMADHMGPAYLRYSFTMGTEQEVGFLVDHLGLRPGMRVLDVGCGPGRHALAMGRRGIHVLGLDISEAFVELGARAASEAGLADRVRFERRDARALGIDGAARGGADGFDLVLSLCQGGFGLLGREEDGAADVSVLAAMGRAVRPGGHLVLSAFSAYFMCRHLESGDSFDAATGVNHERTEVRDAAGRPIEVDLWTTCFTPRELRLMAERAGLEVTAVFGVSPGAYGAERPSTDSHEFLLVARRPA